MPIQQITIVGTGLIGGSVGLALRAYGFTGTIVGCDRPAILEVAQRRGSIDRAEADLERAIEGSDVILFATPVGCILSQFETIAPLVPSDTLITDAGSTKQQFVERARLIYGPDAHARVLPGHPMAGKEHSGIQNADADLFRNATWLITPIDPDSPLMECQKDWLRLLAGLGARLITIDAERHDRLCAWVSHLPQMISTAFATVLRDELGDDEAVVQVGGRALREMTRIAHSPYSMWRDIALTNSENIDEVLLRFEQQLTYLRENLRGPALRELFESANKFGRQPE
jgi:prephenate dehydrogenase